MGFHVERVVKLVAVATVVEALIVSNTLFEIDIWRWGTV